jgi:glycosyltransferase involved in cell wall biosynthesis
MAKTKVLHIIKSLGRGGAEMLLPETLKLHDLSKFEFHYIYFLPWKNQLVDNIEQGGGKVTCFPANNNLQLLKQTQKIINYCQQHHIDLIHAHLPWAGFVARLVHKKNGIPVIYTEHNMQERYHFVTKYLNRFTYNWQTLALGVSKDVSQSIIRSIHPKIPVKTLPNGVNTDYFNRDSQQGLQKRMELNIPQNAIVIGNVAVFRFQKRLKEWLQVMKKITDQHDNVYGLLVGAGPLEADVKKTLADLNLEKKVILPGLQTDMKPFYSAMDIFMMSSSFEGLPIALLEAMSMSCAIVTTDAGGIKEVIRHDLDGLVCPVNAWQRLPELADRLITDPSLMTHFKQVARDRVVQHYSIKTMVSALEDIYKTIGL